MAGRQKPAPFPSKADVVAFIRDSTTRVGKREIARAFRIQGKDRVALKELLRELEDEGLLVRGEGKRVTAADRLPPVAVIEVTGTDLDGEVLARPTHWKSEAPPPRIYLSATRPGVSAPGRGDRILARLKPVGEGLYEAEAIRRIATGPSAILGVVYKGERGFRVQPSDRRIKSDLEIPPGDLGEARAGDLVLVEAESRGRMGLPKGRVVEVIGRLDEPGAFSLIAIHAQGIPVEFPEAALAQAAMATPAPMGRRADLRDLPLVTIDGADARDFDDAVWAGPDPEEDGGWHLVVCIADVAWYVRPDDALDRAAAVRGNSVYFPDRVVPMLPERLSNDLCSLRPAEDRPCLAAHIWIDATGHIRRHRFERAMMRSAARLTYEQVQAARDGRPDEATGALMDAVVRPLYGAFECLQRAREKRGALEIDLPERVVILGEDGRIDRIVPRARLDSHKVIEEFMIAANVAAAEALEKRGRPVMYRIHDAPDPAKAQAIAEFLHDLGYRLALGQTLRPSQFNQVLAKAKGAPDERMINEMVLRSQSQAVYSPDNIGHFGLALRRYCHFTSPIRRYADLLVHRALIHAFGLGEGPLPDGAGEGFHALGERISHAERRAVATERDALDRYTAAFLADRVGAQFAAHVNGVTRFGLFVTLDETGADGLIPISTLPSDYYEHVEARHMLVGRQHGLTFHLGDGVVVRLREAQPITGGLLFELLEGGREGTPSAPAKAGRGSRNKPAGPASRRKGPPRKRPR